MFIVLRDSRPPASINDKWMMKYPGVQSTTTEVISNDTQPIPVATTENYLTDITTTLKEETNDVQTILENTTENQLTDITTTQNEELETTTTLDDHNPISENLSLASPTQSSKLFKFKFCKSTFSLSRPFNFKISNPFFTYNIKFTKSLLINTILPKLKGLIGILQFIGSYFQFGISLISLLL